ncbi:hypothetical protein NHF46_22790 [Arthrobacter alpinus]|nr:hypothetical protein [Arthrobacter alpinus]
MIAMGVAYMWAKSDARETKRKDRAADRNKDADLGAYNDMFAQLAARDVSMAKRPPGPQLPHVQHAKAAVKTERTPKTAGLRTAGLQTVSPRAAKPVSRKPRPERKEKRTSGFRNENHLCHSQPGQGQSIRA